MIDPGPDDELDTDVVSTAPPAAEAVFEPAEEPSAEDVSPAEDEEPSAD